jgi:hypothetical protein
MVAEAMGRVPDLLAARKLLLRTEYVGNFWTTSDGEAVPLSPRAHRSKQPPSPFVTHESYDLPDHPPVDGARSSRVHRFVLAADVASDLNNQLSRDAQQQMWGPKQFFGESKSNVGGYHSPEVAFNSGAHQAWYAALLHDVLLPALRSLAGEGTGGGTSTVDADGVPLEGRISGWLNVSGVHAFNALHRHGTDVLWSLVYYVASGEEAATPEGATRVPAGAASAPTAAAAPDSDAFGWVRAGLKMLQLHQPEPSDTTDSVAADQCGGQLLLRTEPDPQTGSLGYFPIRPRAGELWFFPGYMAHCVLPRDVRIAAPPRGTEENSNGGLLRDLAARLTLMPSSEPRREARISVREPPHALRPSPRRPLTPVHSPCGSPGRVQRLFS